MDAKQRVTPWLSRFCSVGVMALVAACDMMPFMDSSTGYAAPTPYPEVYGSQLDGSEQWQLIAENEAQLLVDRFEQPPSLQLATPDDPELSPFTQAYQHFLRMGLIDRGLQVFSRTDGLPVHSEARLIPAESGAQLMITTEVRKEDQVLYSHSAVFQVDTDDLALYARPRGFAVRGPSAY